MSLKCNVRSVHMYMHQSELSQPELVQQFLMVHAYFTSDFA